MIEKQTCKKDFDALKAEKESMAADLHREMANRERSLLDEFEGQKVGAAQLRTHLNATVTSNLVLQKEAKRLKDDLERMEAFRMSYQTVGVLNKRVDTSYRSLLSLHWQVMEVCTSIRKSLLVAVASHSSTDHPGGEVGSRVASVLSTAGALTDEELEDAVRAMALEDLDHLAALNVAVRNFAERNNLKSAHAHPSAHAPSTTSPCDIPVTPWSDGVKRPAEISGTHALLTYSPGHRSGSPPRAPDRLVEVLAAIPDQPAVTIPGSRPLLHPIDMVVKSSVHSAHASYRGGKPPQSLGSNFNSSVHTIPTVASDPLPMPLVIHDGMPKRVGSSHQALSGKHRQIIQTRNDRDVQQRN